MIRITVELPDTAPNLDSRVGAVVVAALAAQGRVTIVSFRPSDEPGPGPGRS